MIFRTANLKGGRMDDELAHFGGVDRERPAVLVNERWLDCPSHSRIGITIVFQERLRSAAVDPKADLTSLPEVETSQRVGATIARPGKVICVGLDYSDHAAESQWRSRRSRSVSKSKQYSCGAL